MADKCDMNFNPDQGSLKGKTRWFQFRLRTLFIVLFICSIGLSWLATRLQSYERQEAAIKHLQKAGYSLQYEKANANTVDGVIRKLAGQDIICVDARGPGSYRVFQSSEADSLKLLSNLRLLSIMEHEFDDDSLSKLGGLTNLETLMIDYSGVTGEAFRHLGNLTQLKEVSVEDTPVNDSGVTYLCDLCTLQHLNLAGTKITNTCLEHILKKDTLQMLDVSNTQITEEGLIKLGGMDNLKMLHVDSTQLTESGIAKLKRDLPNTKIIVLEP